MSTGFLDIFIIITYALVKTKLSLYTPSVTGNGGCYLKGFYLEDTKDNLQITHK